MNKPYQAPLNGTQKQLKRARAAALHVIDSQVAKLAELRAFHRRIGGSGSKNLNTTIKFLKAFREELARGDYDKASIACVLGEPPFVSSDGSTPAYPDPANFGDSQ